ASKTVVAGHRFEARNECELTLEGFIAFLDPPKEGVGLAIKELEDLGIAVKIITGDHEILAEKVCRQVGLPIINVITGDQLAKMSESELEKRLPEVTVF